VSNAKDWREVKARAALRDRIATAILDYHEEWGGGLCRCGHYHEGTPEHLADAVIEELNLHTDKVGTWIRHVTDWEPNDES